MINYMSIAFYYCTPTTLFGASCEILTCDSLDDVIQSAAPYVIIKYRESKHNRGQITHSVNVLFAIRFSK